MFKFNTETRCRNTAIYIFSTFFFIVASTPLMVCSLQTGMISLAILMNCRFALCSKRSQRVIGKRYSRNVVQARYQIFGLGETKKKIDDALDSLKMTSDRTNDIANQIFSVLNPSDTIFDNAVAKGLMSLTRIIVNCSMAKDDLKIWNFVFNVSSEFGPSAVKHLIPLFKKNGAIPANRQFDLSDFSSTGVQNFFGKNKTLTRTAMAASLAILLQLALGLPITTNADSLIKYFGDRSRNLNNIVTFGKNSADIFQSASDYVLETILPGYATTEMDEYVSGYDKWARDVMSLGNVEDPVENRIQKDKKLVFLIDKLYKQGIGYSTIIKSLRVKPALVEHYQRVFKIIEDYRKKCDYTGVFGNRPRCKPLVCYLFGPSGVGKSGMTWPLAADLNALFSSDVEQAKDFASEIYFRNVEQEFWDGYCGQSIVVYDDFGQRTDSGNSPNEEYMEVIRTANIAPYPLHMAQIEEKKRTKFVSKAIILTSNILSQKISSLTFPDAVFRRVDVCGEVGIKPEFAKVCYSDTLNASVSRLDRSKCNGPVDTRPYIITMYDPESKMPIRDAQGEIVKLSYDDFLKTCASVAERSFEDSMCFNTLLSERINEDRFASIKGLTNVKLSAPMQPVSALTSDELAKVQLAEYKLGELIAANLQVAPSLEERARIALAERKLAELKAKFDPQPKTISISTMWNSVGHSCSHMWNMVKTAPTNCKRMYMRAKERLFYERELVFTMDPDAGIFYDHRFKISTTEIREAMREKIEGVMKLKNLLFVIGLILVGFGAWKMFSKSDKHVRYPDSNGLAETPAKMMNKINSVLCNQEATSSGDSLTRTVPHMKTEAVGSGDANTQRVPRLTTEAFTSGDSRTHIAPRVATEAVVSGDPRTVNVVRTKVEASSSNDCVTTAPKRTYTEFFGTTPVPSNMQAWSDKTAGDLISHRVLSNMYKLESGGIKLLNGLFIRDTVMLVPRHVLPFIKEKLTITNSLGTKYTVPITSLKVVGISDRAGNDKDAILIQFPRHVHSHSDIVKHFQTMPELQLRRVNVCVPTLRYLRDQWLFYILGNQTATFDQINLDIDGEIVNIREAIRYQLNTENGDCGAPVIVNENSVLRKIAGIHIAAANDASAAYGQSITQNDLLVHLAQLPMQPIITDLDDLPNFLIVPSTLQVETQYTAEDLVSLTKLPAATFGYAGSCSATTFAPSVTDITPSVIHGYTQTLTKPAKLRHPSVNILHKNVEKCALNTPYISESEVKRAVSEVQCKLLSGTTRETLNKVLSFEDAIQGNDTSTFIGPINRRTSPGYPWVLDKIFGKVGKTQWLGEDEYLFPDEVRDVVNKRIDSAKQGVRVATVWTDTLKDERRPVAKVDALKTRVFSHGPFDYTIAFRMYFLGFIAHIMENRIDNEQSIGTNPFSQDWKRTYNKLQKKGKRVFAGDFSTFDGTLNSCIMSEFAAVANKFYNDGPENALIREVLMLDIFNSIHLCEKTYYQCTHSQPSGNPLTTVLNSFYNSVSMRIAFYRVVKQDFDFESEVSMVSYGDDNVVNISDRVSDVFNQNSVTTAYATFGMIYTDEAKSDGVSPDYRNISEVAYLKRGFRMTPFGYVRAPMSLDTLTETPQWIRKTPEHIEACKLNVESCVRELAQHPKAIFDEYSEKMCSAFYEATNVYPLVGDYGYYEQLLNEEYY
nr:MAG: hypothetical protein 2 [Aparavirus sp.]